GNIQSYYRRFLYCLGNTQTVAGIIDTTKFRFVFQAGANTLTSVKEYSDQADINADLPGFISLAMEQTNYCLKKEGDETAVPPIPPVWNVYLTDGNCNSLAKSNDFTSLQ